ncbi:MAG: acyl carrier protein [Hyphomicrobium sp.]|nr:acyl carrier protein [Hyphomicrobium sp.]
MLGQKPRSDELSDVATSARESVVEMLTVIVGEDYLEGIEIDDDTRFDLDLEIESIEFVTFAEMLVKRYGDQVNFIAWLGEKELDDIIGISVGEVVDFIVASLEAKGG